MELTEEELFDYIKCPAYYDMKHNRKLGYTEQPTMQRLLDKVSRSFYSNLLNKTVLTMDQLKKKWDSVCKDNKEYIDSKKNLEGINYIINFARWAASNKIVLADFESSYTISVDNIRLVGTIGPVSVLPGRKCELISNRFSNREPSQSDIDKQLKFTMDCMAFKQAYHHDISAIKVIHFKNNKEFITNRTQTDYDRVRSTIKGVANGIESKAFYPREGVFCSTCEMRTYCKYWN